MSTRKVYIPVSKRKSKNQTHELVPSPSRLKRKYCKPDCLAQYKRVSQKKKVQNSRDRASGRTQMQNEIFQRDGGSCIHCKSKRNIQYAHVVPFKITHQNNPRNMILLCKRCHAIFDGKTTPKLRKWYRRGKYNYRWLNERDSIMETIEKYAKKIQ